MTSKEARMGNEQKAHALRESFLAGNLSPRSPGIGSTPSRPDKPTVTQRRDREQARRQARTEAVLGRASAGTGGDVDAPDAAVEHTVVMEARQTKEEILRGA